MTHILILLALFISTAQAAPIIESDNDRVRREEAVFHLHYYLHHFLRDPDSLVVEGAMSTRDAKVVCIQYRARNGFGGMNRDIIAQVNNLRYSAEQAGADRCREATIDMTYVIRRAEHDHR